MIWSQELEDVGKVAFAYLLALPVGWYREKEAHSVGVRTMPIVAVASCAFILLVGGWGRASMDAQSRVLQGIAAGIGFVGGGAILKSENRVHGTATAATIWNIAAMGAAVALEHYLVAVFLALLNFVTLFLLLRVKQSIDQDEKDPPASPAKRGPDG
ncbi:MAG TPA: MgtC/SapB family protein [Verrucomicrobiae bacterium]|nr:MgtC/SapB family protein [Verrucomicrobiae bacterium]